MNNSTVTRASGICGNWGGIVVKGAGSGTDQSNTSIQGYLYINYSTISRANLAVDVEGGGVIITDNADFTMNVMDVKLEPFSDSNFPHNNLCEFSLTNFDVTVNVSLTRVELDRVEGVYFYGCTFGNNELWSNASTINSLGIGIYATDSRFTVTGKDLILSSDDGCIESHTTSSYFSNFSIAIKSIYTGGSFQNLPLSVEDTRFISNYIGINTENGESLLVRFCQFLNNQGVSPAAVWSSGCKGILINYSKASVDQEINNNIFETDISVNDLDFNYFCFVRAYGGFNFTKNEVTSTDFPLTPTINNPTKGLYLEDATYLTFACNTFHDVHIDFDNLSGVNSIGSSSWELTNWFSRGTNRIANIVSNSAFDYFLTGITVSPNIPIPNGGGTNISIPIASNSMDCNGCNPELPAGRSVFASNKVQTINITRTTEYSIDLVLSNLDFKEIDKIMMYNMFTGVNETITDIKGKTVFFVNPKKGFYVVYITLKNGSDSVFKIYIN